MNAIFYLIINNVSVTSVILISILIFRIVFKNIPKRIYPMLWGVAGLKLLFPFDIYTSFGVLSSEKTIETATSGNAPIIIRTGVKTLDQGVNHYIGTISKGHVASANNTIF